MSCRFIRTKFALAEALERKQPSVVSPEYVWGSRSLNACYEAVFHLYRGFIGSPHFASVCRLLGYQGIFIIFTEILKVCKSLVSSAGTFILYPPPNPQKEIFGQTSPSLYALLLVSIDDNDLTPVTTSTGLLHVLAVRYYKVVVSHSFREIWL
ncbi:unnamed protein product [Dibothriocephalus latus]|uniref:Uncharacterized protein n=1 Tax=Dibothriocephalus latus TaxID=60516 RepID=A0A3P7NXZ5_DIBLA|nr:unnamed protein product [Dibothriocephalus latus]